MSSCRATNANAKDALELVRAHREMLEEQVLNAELRLKRAVASGDEVPDEAVGALTEMLGAAASRVAEVRFERVEVPR